MCFGAASAKQRIDVAIRNSINAGEIPGPRLLANGKELAPRDGSLVDGITTFVETPEEARAAIRFSVEQTGVDLVSFGALSRPC